MASDASAADRSMSAEVRIRLELDDFYAKVLETEGLFIIASDQVSDVALAEAGYLINQMLLDAPSVRKRLAESDIRIAIMAPSEMTTDLPEHRHLRPADYWDRRARGLGASRENPVVSCGEENLLGLEGDPYEGESILIHEFAHAVHSLGLGEDGDFDARLRAAFASAKENKLWQGTYATTNHKEYWAEGVQVWFECNPPPNKVHNDIRTRAQLLDYDAGLCLLLREVFGESDWRYQRPADREAAGHLAGLDSALKRRFEWPPELANVDVKDRPKDRSAE